MRKRIGVITCAWVALICAPLSSAYAAVSPEEAKSLDGPKLTFAGAERAGNQEGTIPVWVGDRSVTVPADYDPKEPGRLPDPWKEKPLFSISAQNYEQYAATLTPGQAALFKKYQNYRMDIYPSHRIATVPTYVKENTLKNATSCKASADGLQLEGCYGGYPFPIPKTGHELMWNHQLAYSVHAMTYQAQTYTRTSRGPVLEADNISHEYFPFYDPKRKTPFATSEAYWKIRFAASAPARKVGEAYLIIDSLDGIERVWTYIPGQRRVKLAPNLAYDTPNPQSGGIQTMDQPKLFLGKQDRYEMKLVGKQERYIIPNSFNSTDNRVCPNDRWLATASFPNPDCMRWELHRVWVVELTIKPQYRHILPRRTIYFDEDTYAAGFSDDYDAAGTIYRVTFNPSWPLYNTGHGGYVSSFANSIDLQVGMYNVGGLVSVKNNIGPAEEVPPPDYHFTSENMAGTGIR